MGDLIDLASRKKHVKENQVKEALDEQNAFYDEYEASIAMIEEMVNDILLDLDVKEAYNSESFLLREALMAVHMRNLGISHPLHTFVDNVISPLIGLLNPVEFDDGEDETDNS